MSEQIPVFEADNFGPINDQIFTSVKAGTFIAGDATGSTIYNVSEPPLIGPRKLDLVGEIGAQGPSNISNLVHKLEQTRLIILQAPPSWGQEDVAEHLAKQAVIQLSNEKNPLSVYEPTPNISGGAFEQALGSLQYKIRNAVIIASNFDAANFSITQLENINRLARAEKYNLYVIITTQSSRDEWPEVRAQNTFEFVNLPTNSPYEPSDLAQWVCRLIELPDHVLVKQRLIDIGVIGSGPIKPDTELKGLEFTPKVLPQKLASPITVQVLTQHLLSSPGMVRSFPDVVLRLDEEVIRSKNVRELVNQIEHLVYNQDKQWQYWFEHLADPARYLVLALSLVGDLPPDVFWAIYERLVKEAWRERDLFLTMTDYLKTESELKRYITVSSDGLDFNDPNVREKLVDYALKGYRRSLVQALPIIADIITTVRKPDADQPTSVVDLLRTLAIFGSDLTSATESQKHQITVRGRLIRSIAQIALSEGAATEHLLLAWAEASYGLGFYTFTETLMQMYQLETPTRSETDKWYQKRNSFQLLQRWYSRFFADDTQDNNFELRRSNIRTALAYALCELGTMESFTSADFGMFDPMHPMLRAIPSQLPTIDEIGSPWEMLVAMTWHPDDAVRLRVVNRIQRLHKRYPRHVESLLFLMASDPNVIVRLSLSQHLVNHFKETPLQRYMIEELLNENDPAYPYINWKELPETHYLKQNVDKDEKFSFGVWTAIFTLLLASKKNSDLLTLLLHTRLHHEDTSEYPAFVNVLQTILSSEALVEFLKTVLTQILLDRTGDNRASAASNTLHKMLTEPLRETFKLTQAEKESNVNRFPNKMA